MAMTASRQGACNRSSSSALAYLGASQLCAIGVIQVHPAGVIGVNQFMGQGAIEHFLCGCELSIHFHLQQTQGSESADHGRCVGCLGQVRALLVL